MVFSTIPLNIIILLPATVDASFIDFGDANLLFCSATRCCSAMISSCARRISSWAALAPATTVSTIESASCVADDTSDVNHSDMEMLIKCLFCRMDGRMDGWMDGSIDKTLYDRLINS